MVDLDGGTAADVKAPSDLETYFIHAGGGAATGHAPNERRYWGEPKRCYLGVPHNNADRKKKTKRKQAQASRRKNRRQ